MKRCLLTILAWLSLLLCLTLAGLWARSYWHEDPWRLWMDSNSGWFLVSSSGRITFARQEVIPTNPPSYASADCSIYRTLSVKSLRTSQITATGASLTVPPRPGRGFAGFEYADWGNSGIASPPLGFRFRAVTAPHWFWILLTGIPPAIWFHHRRRHALRLRRGLCLTCGYDLRASKERCPECGTLMQADAESHSQSAGLTC